MRGRPTANQTVDTQQLANQRTPNNQPNSGYPTDNQTGHPTTNQTEDTQQPTREYPIANQTEDTQQPTK